MTKQQWRQWKFDNLMVPLIMILGGIFKGAVYFLILWLALTAANILLALAQQIWRSS